MRLEIEQLARTIDVPSDGLLSEFRQLPRVFERHFAADMILYGSGDCATHLWFLRSGCVTISTASPQGKQMMLRFLAGPTVLGEDIFSSQRQYSHTATALSPCVAQLIRLEDTCDLMRRKPELTKEMFRVVGQRMVTMHRKAEQLAVLFVEARVAILLPEISFWFEVAQRRLTHERIAGYVGSSRETVSTVISFLRRAGVIDVDKRGYVTVLNSATLHDWVQKKQCKGIAATIHKRLPPIGIL